MCGGFVQNAPSASGLRTGSAMVIASDIAASSASRGHRRRVAVLQADVARAVRVAQEAGSAWHVEIGGNVIRLVQGEPAGNDSRRASRDHDVDRFLIVQCDQVREARQPEHRRPPPRPRRRSRYRRRPLPYRRMAHDHEQAWGGLTLAFYTDWPTSFWISGGRAIMNPLPTQPDRRAPSLTVSKRMRGL